MTYFHINMIKTFHKITTLLFSQKGGKDTKYWEECQFTNDLGWSCFSCAASCVFQIKINLVWPFRERKCRMSKEKSSLTYNKLNLTDWEVSTYQQLNIDLLGSCLSLHNINWQDRPASIYLPLSMFTASTWVFSFPWLSFLRVTVWVWSPILRIIVTCRE